MQRFRILVNRIPLTRHDHHSALHPNIRVEGGTFELSMRIKYLETRIEQLNSKVNKLENQVYYSESSNNNKSIGKRTPRLN